MRVSALKVEQLLFGLKPLKRRWLLLWGCIYALCMACIIATGAGLYAVLSPEDRDLAERLLAASGDFAMLIFLVLFALLGLLASWLTQTYFAPLLRAAEQIRLISTANPATRVDAVGPSELRVLAQAMNSLAQAHQKLGEDDAKRIDEARADLEHERHRLAALMAQLTQGVVVCNADGRILLYNELARSLLSAATTQNPAAGGVGYLGIGRSLYALMHRESVEHALAQLRARIASGTDDPVTTFATSIANGAIVRVRIAPVAAATVDGGPATAGYVLLLEDLSRELSELEHRDALLTGLIERSRAALASVRAATENLASQAEMPAPLRSRFLDIAQEELLRLTQLVERTGTAHAERMNRRPDLQPMRVAELLEAVAGKVRSVEGVTVEVEPGESALWVQVDSYALMQAVRYFVKRLMQGRGSLALTLRASPAGEYVYFDSLWPGPEIPASTLLEWEIAPLSAGGETSDLTLRELVSSNRAEVWHEAHAASGQACLRIMLRRVAADAPQRPVARGGRPVYYDFDLFHQPDPHHAIDDLPLSALSYTVFDTETTGLEPSAGDEIISIGAVRIVNGRLLRSETFDQLIDPKRPIDLEAAKIHGIGPSMLAGQPDIGGVLPSFHRFCEDTVLVGHNAAFDLRFLQIKEASTGLRFANPVLDTLLLSAVLYEAMNDHRLEAIAQRLGVAVIGRHTALGDAIVTAEVFLRMLPLLTARGILTLRQARAASEHTRYAKLHY